MPPLRRSDAQSLYEVVDLLNIMCTEGRQIDPGDIPQDGQGLSMFTSWLPDPALAEVDDGGLEKGEALLSCWGVATFAAGSRGWEGRARGSCRLSNNQGVSCLDPCLRRRAALALCSRCNMYANKLHLPLRPTPTLQPPRRRTLKRIGPGLCATASSSTRPQSVWWIWQGSPCPSGR